MRSGTITPQSSSPGLTRGSTWMAGSSPAMTGEGDGSTWRNSAPELMDPLATIGKGRTHALFGSHRGKVGAAGDRAGPRRRPRRPAGTAGRHPGHDPPGL